MLNLLPIEVFFWYANLALKLVLLWRIFSLGLAAHYKALCFAMVLASARTLVLLPLNVNTYAYAVTYLITQPLLLLAYGAVVLEVYGQVFETYQGISFLGRGFLVTGFVVSGAISLWVHLAEFNLSDGPFRVLRYLLTAESTLYGVLLLFLLALALFLLWYPVPLRKNLLHYNLIFLVFFGAMSAGLYMGNPNPSSMAARLGSTMRMAVDTACLSCWIFLFRREWEEQAGGVSFALTKADQAQILGHLDSMNQAILRARKSL